MKKHITVFLIYFLAVNAKSQVVFCPPGAEWRYNFYESAGGFPGGQQVFLEKITYTHDSILGSDLVKILRHNFFYLQCNVMNSGITFIKQKGDTIFMKNDATGQSWQILYNFNVIAGDYWQTNVKANIGAPTVIPYTVFVDSVKYMTVNGFSLKHLYVRYEHYLQSTLKSWRATITERLGCGGFMFNYYNASEGGCDGDFFQRNLCYKDTQFGTKQFTSFPCDFEDLTGIDEHQIENEILKVYPNPVNDKLNVEFNSFESSNFKMELINSLGLLVNTINVVNQKQEMDLSFLPSGIYFLKLQNNSEQKVFKIVKE